MSTKIVINALSARRGGGKTYLLNLLKHIPEDITKLEVLLLVPGTFEVSESELGSSVQLKRYNVDNPFIRIFVELVSIPFMLKSVGPGVYFSPGGLLFPLTKGKWKSVTMFRNMIPFDLAERKKYPIGYMRFRNWFLSKLLLRSMLKADLVIFISHFALDHIQKITYQGINKYVVISHGVGDDFHKAENQREVKIPNLPVGEEFIFYPSIIDVYKSQLEVVDAIALLLKKGVEVPKLVLCGEIYGGYGKLVTERIERLGLNENVIISGPIPYDQMPLAYANCKFVLFASKSENCPNILLESLASNCAILCSNMMPMPEFAGDAVMYFDPADSRDIARAIELFLSSDEMIEKYSSKARQQGLDFRWETTARRTWSVLVS